MIECRELRITPDGNYLIIDAAIKNDSYFDDMSISEIAVNHIDKDDNNTNLWSTALKETPVYTEDSIVTTEDTYVYIEGNYRHVRVQLPKVTLGKNLNTELFEVIIQTSGTLNNEMPEGYATTKTKAFVVNLYPYYRHYISLMKKYTDSCCIPKELVNAIISLKALEVSLKINDESNIINYWYNHFSKLNVFKSCNCYG